MTVYFLTHLQYDSLMTVDRKLSHALRVSGKERLAAWAENLETDLHAALLTAWQKQADLERAENRLRETVRELNALKRTSE